MVFKNERMENGKWRTVDQKRDVALQMVGDMLYDPVEFRLGFEGEIVRFKAFQDIKQLENAWAIEWLVVNITAAPHLKQDIPRLHTMIEEALDAYGFAASRKMIDSVSVTFA